jgi:hypothetical protein
MTLQAKEETHDTVPPIIEAVLHDEVLEKIPASHKAVRVISPLVLIAVVVAFYFSYQTRFQEMFSHKAPLDDVGAQSLAADHEHEIAALRARIKARRGEPEVNALSSADAVMWDDDVWQEDEVEDALPVLLPTDAQEVPPEPAQPDAALLVQHEALLQAQLTQAQQQEHALQAQIAALQQHLIEAGAQRGEQSQALQRLELAARVLAHSPYTDALTQAVFLTPQERAALAPFAAQGVPSVEQLQARMAQVVDAFYAQPSTAADGLWRGIVAQLRTLVQVRKVGASHTGNDMGAVLARAQAQLQSGDLSASAQELSALPPQACCGALALRDELLAIQAASVWAADVTRMRGE